MLCLIGSGDTLLKYSVYFKSVIKIGLESYLLFMHRGLFRPMYINRYITECVHNRNVGEVLCRNVIFFLQAFATKVLKMRILDSICLSFYAHVTSREPAGRMFIKFSNGKSYIF
jgi:hypothetical protein